MTALVCLEGADGTSKSTIAAMLPAMLSPLTSRVFAHEHPGVCDAWASALWYAAQRAEVASRMALGLEPDVVIADRWWMTASVFAEVRDDAAAAQLASMEERMLPRPALVVVLDASDATLATRRPDASRDEVRARALYRDPARLARWGASVVNVEGRGAVEIAREVAGMVAHALRIARWHADNERVLREREGR